MSNISISEFLYVVEIDTVHDPISFTYADLNEALTMLLEITVQGYEAHMKLKHNGD